MKGIAMKCPHCSVQVHPGFGRSAVTFNGQSFRALNWNKVEVTWAVDSMVCPACNKGILTLQEYSNSTLQSSRFIVPKTVTRQVPAAEVPEELAEDFLEAAAVIRDSPKASAALSRRCLQALLRAQGFNDHNLAKAIDAALKSKQLPAALSTSLDAVRNIGNFAAHPMKDEQTGQILPVEPDEADWNLDVLEGLFDFYYVLPAREQEKINALNKKLSAAGKPPIK